jgi:hypothetical protein
MSRKNPPPEFVTFWAELATLGGKPVTESMTPTYSRTPEELSIRAKTSAALRLSKHNIGKAKVTNKTEER